MIGYKASRNCQIILFQLRRLLVLHIFPLRRGEMICLASVLIEFGLEPPTRSSFYYTISYQACPALLKLKEFLR